MSVIHGSQAKTVAKDFVLVTVLAVARVWRGSVIVTLAGRGAIVACSCVHLIAQVMVTVVLLVSVYVTWVGVVVIALPVFSAVREARLALATVPVQIAPTPWKWGTIMVPLCWEAVAVMV